MMGRQTQKEWSKWASLLRTGLALPGTALPISVLIWLTTMRQDEAQLLFIIVPIMVGLVAALGLPWHLLMQALRHNSLWSYLIWGAICGVFTWMPIFASGYVVGAGFFVGLSRALQWDEAGQLLFQTVGLCLLAAVLFWLIAVARFRKQEP